jgi:hypothetical protein
VSIPLAHGIGGIKDLPVPLWLFYYGAAIVLLLSFAALWALWQTPVLERASRGRPLPSAVQMLVVNRAARTGLGALGFGLLVAVIAAAAAGDSSTYENLAPTFVYITFWLGTTAVVVLLGDVWSVVNPWRAAADALVWLSRRSGLVWETPFAYPPRLGRWPGAIALFAFAALELAYSDPGDPRALAVAILAHSTVTWLGMLAFGREAWISNGEAFSVYFGFLARIAPLGVRRRTVAIRWPLSGLTGLDVRPGTLAFVAGCSALSPSTA